jgi:glycosyltransferase involved in cell wall biosynthesis
MRVAHCIHGLGLGGAQEVIRQLVAGRSDGFRHLVYSCEDGILLPRVAAAGARVRVLPRRLPKLDPGWVVRLARAMRADRVDLVHTHLFGDSLHGFLAARAAGPLPVVMTLHSQPGLSTPLQRAGYRWLAARVDQVVACGASVAQAFAGWRTVRPLRTIANGIAVSAASDPAPDELARRRAELGLPPQALLFAAVGRLVPVKGYHHLLAALAAARPALPADARLVLIGDGPQGAALRAQAAAAGLGGQVLFAGARDDAAGWLAAADVAVFSSTSEGLPMALLEAMAAARCIVATALPGIAEAVSEERQALIVPPGDVRALSAALVRVAADSQLRRRLGDAARTRFLAAFTAPRMVAAYEAVYRDTCNAARQGCRRHEAPAA